MHGTATQTSSHSLKAKMFGTCWARYKSFVIPFLLESAAARNPTFQKADKNETLFLRSMPFPVCHYEASCLFESVIPTCKYKLQIQLVNITCKYINCHLMLFSEVAFVPWQCLFSSVRFRSCNITTKC